MFHLFWCSDRRHEEVADAARRHDAAFDELREALHQLLAERNHDRKPPEERTEKPKP